MTKATAPITPRRVLGNRLSAERLSIEEASAVLVAMVAGSQAIPPRRELRSIARAIGKRQTAARSASLQTKGARNV